MYNIPVSGCKKRTHTTYFVKKIMSLIHCVFCKKFRLQKTIAHIFGQIKTFCINRSKHLYTSRTPTRIGLHLERHHELATVERNRENNLAACWAVYIRCGAGKQTKEHMFSERERKREREREKETFKELGGHSAG